MNSNQQKVIGFLEAVSDPGKSARIEDLYHPDIEQIEYPNAIVKTTANRSLKELKEASERGKKVMTKQRYDIINIFSEGEVVILEAKWTGTIAVPFGNIPAGGEMTAHFAQFFEFRDGKIFRQRNYDCFDPF